MIDKAIEYVISFLKRFFFYITNLLIIMIYFVSLEPISSGLKSYSENGQQFYSSNLVDVYPWSILIILVLAALPLLIHLKTKNNLDSKFLFFFNISTLLIKSSCLKIFSRYIFFRFLYVFFFPNIKAITINTINSKIPIIG